MTQDQKDILSQKIALWEARLCSSIVVDITFKNEDLGSYYSGMPPAPAVYNSVHWDGRNAYGMIVSNGIYFCRLQVGVRSETKKVVFSR